MPQPIINKAGCNLSFAGLKTAVLREAQKIKNNDQMKFNLAASFQETVIKILKKKTLIAFKEFEKLTKSKNKTFVIAGGVAANISIRNNLKKLAEENNFKPVFSSLEFCGDNAAMIAWAGIQRYKKKLINELDVMPKSRWQLDKNAKYMKGPGLKL